ncbi:pro-pol polyprotein [Plakobranchus ocellatus]|uniref:Pro-pol polyprotein n=1 Tax=Plakobranchus ocellatus TaxID=259542 RepID=A0AAV4BTY7_9GAST|nr:pro-pol polyprotein [Plakobranchus ocellatus]
MVERLNGSLKRMLNKLVEEKPDDWDKLLPAVLFAYREVPNTSTGYAPFKLMFGREVRGSTDVLAGCISGAENRSEKYLFVKDYARELQQDIRTAYEIASKNAEQSLKKNRESKNMPTKFRELEKDTRYSYYYLRMVTIYISITNANTIFRLSRATTTSVKLAVTSERTMQTC